MATELDAAAKMEEEIRRLATEIDAAAKKMEEELRRLATEIDAAAKKMEEEFRREFRRLQSRLLARLSSTAFSRTTWILGFVGALLLCYTLFKTPNVQGGLPLPLNHEYLIAFSVASGVGILLNVSAFLIHLLAWINEMNLNKTQPPSLEVILKCFRKQNKLIIALQVIDGSIFHFGSLFQVYVFLVGLPAIFISDVDPNSYSGSAFKAVETSSYTLMAFRMLFEYPRHWQLN